MGRLLGVPGTPGIPVLPARFPRVRPYGVDAAFMLVQRRGCGIHIGPDGRSVKPTRCRRGPTPGDSRIWTPAGPAPDRSRAPAPRRRRSAPPGPPNPRCCGRRRAGRWPRPRAVEQIRLSNTPSKIIRPAMSSEALTEVRLSTGNSPMSVEKCCGSSPENPPQTFSSTQPVDRIFPVHNPRVVGGMIISTVLSPGCAQRSRRVCTLCPHPCPLYDLVPGAAGRQNVSAVGYNGVRPQ
jgi:hypothetical protein